MKYAHFVRNAGSKAERFFHSGFAFLFALAIILMITVTAVRYVNETRENEIRARRGLYRTMETNMAKCAQIGVKMQYAGADIEGELLPELRTYLYALKNMTDAFYISFGEEYSPVRAQFLSKVEGACERLNRDLKSGYSSENSQKALQMCLSEFSEILDKWDFE